MTWLQMEAGTGDSHNQTLPESSSDLLISYSVMSENDFLVLFLYCTSNFIL